MYLTPHKSYRIVNKLWISIAFVVLCYFNVYAQKNYNFKLASKQTKISNSLYNELSVLDNRGDTTSMGFIDSFLGSYTPVVPAKTISNQFKSLFNSVTDGKAANGKLLLHITRLLFAERVNQLNYDAYFNMRAYLYIKVWDHYQKVAAIDTLVTKTSFLPSKEIINAANEIMANFIIKNLNVNPTGPVLTFHDVLNIANIEKSELSLYNNTNYVDGLYLTYKSFKNQLPDKKISIDSTDLNTGNIKTIEGNGVTLKVKAHNVYAIVYKGIPYVVSEGIYYPLKKVNNNFFFTGKARISSVPGDELVSDIAGGDAGDVILGVRKATFDMEIDYKSGVFIRLKKVDGAQDDAVKQK